jgi:hypothetical protein
MWSEWWAGLLARAGLEAELGRERAGEGEAAGAAVGWDGRLNLREVKECACAAEEQVYPGFSTRWRNRLIIDSLHDAKTLFHILIFTGWDACSTVKLEPGAFLAFQNTFPPSIHFPASYVLLKTLLLLPFFLLFFPLPSFISSLLFPSLLHSCFLPFLLPSYSSIVNLFLN